MRVARFDTEEESVVGRAFEIRNAEQRMVESRESGEKQHAEKCRARGKQDRELEHDHDERRANYSVAVPPTLRG